MHMYTHIHTHSHTYIHARADRSIHMHTDAPKFKVEVLNYYPSSISHGFLFRDP